MGYVFYHCMYLTDFYFKEKIPNIYRPKTNLFSGSVLVSESPKDKEVSKVDLTFDHYGT